MPGPSPRAGRYSIEHKWRLHKHIVEIIDKEDPAYIEPLNLMVS